MRYSILFAAALLTAACQSVPAPRPAADGRSVVVLRNVRVYSGDATVTTARQDVFLAGDRIEWVGPSGTRAVPSDAAVIDGAGRTVMPGLIDMHAHASGGSAPPWALSLPNAEQVLRAFLYAGVTTIVDLGGALDESVTLRDRIERGELPGPRMLVSGPHFTADGGHPVAMLRVFLPWYLSLFVSDELLGVGVSEPEEARVRVAEFLEAGVDVIKMTSDDIPLGVPLLSSEAAAAVAETAHAGRRLVFAHIGTNADAWRMVAAGADILAHNVYREPLTAGTAKMLAEKNVAVTTTLAVFGTIDRLIQGNYELGPLQRAVGDPGVVNALLSRPADYRAPEAFRGYLDMLHKASPYWAGNVQILREHGVRLLIGSDSPNIGQFGGATLHQEIDLLAAAGMPAGEILRAVTAGNAQAIGRGDDLGRVAPGYRADLLLVDGDPLLDLGAVHRIVSVLQGGAVVDRDGLL